MTAMRIVCTRSGVYLVGGGGGAGFFFGFRLGLRLILALRLAFGFFVLAVFFLAGKGIPGS